MEDLARRALARARSFVEHPPRLTVREVVVEIAVVAAGIAAGLAVAVVLLTVRARVDVANYLADPPRPPASVVWSAPMALHVGQQADPETIAADLLAAGLDRVEEPVEPTEGDPGQFSVRTTGTKAVLDLWASDWRAPTGNVAGGHVVVEIANGRVAKTTPRGRVVLRPTVLGTLGDPETQREPVRLAGVSRWLEPALLAMEDSRFRSHGGVDPIGIARALIADLLHRDTQGGSTLTQQLAKNLFLSSERTVRRKVRELFFAAALEAELGKDQLLELYLSEIYLGQMGGMPIYGVEAAARAWFGTSAAKLDLAQAATLIGVIPAPNAWSPARNPDGAVERRNLVLKKMAGDGLVAPDELEAALATPLRLTGLPPSRVRRAPYAVDLAVELAEESVPADAFATGGYALYTAIDPVLQHAAEEALTAGMADLERDYPKLAGVQAALVAVRVEDGAVVALVGGRSYAKSPFDRARDAHRQVGSTVKPFTMLAAIDAGLATPATRLADEPITRVVSGETWTPRNYDGTYLGEISLRSAIENSRNIPAVLLSERVGHANLSRFLHQVGLPDATALPSAALGSFPATPLELAGAYTVFDRGVASRPRVLLAVGDPALAAVRTFAPEQVAVASPEAAAVATHVLEGVITSGTATRASQWGIGPPAAGKTGTTDEYRDAWFVGLTREYAIAVWVGQDEGILGLSGAKAALPTWSRFVAAIGMDKTPRPMPPGVVAVAVCEDTGQLARPACPLRADEWLVEADLPPQCEEHGDLFRLGELFDWLRPRQREPLGAPGEDGIPPRPKRKDAKRH